MNCLVDIRDESREVAVRWGECVGVGSEVDRGYLRSCCHISFFFL